MTNKQTIDGVSRHWAEIEAAVRGAFEDGKKDYNGCMRERLRELRALLDKEVNENSHTPEQHAEAIDLLERVYDQGDTYGLIGEEIANFFAGRSKPTAQPQGEVGPVAFVCDAATTHHGCPEGCGDILSEWLPVGTELYAHADAGEVERLRADLASTNADKAAYAQNAIDLRAQLAERDALLREIQKSARKQDWAGGYPTLFASIESALSTSAEPKPRGEAIDNPVIGYADSYRAMARQGVETVSIWSVITDLERNIAPLCAEQPAPVAVVLPGIEFSFEHWWETSGQYCRAGGGDYEKTFGYRAYEAAIAEVAKLNGLKP